MDKLASDVTLEGSLLDGAVQGAEAVRAVVDVARELYDRQDFNFAGPWGDNSFIEHRGGSGTSRLPSAHSRVRRASRHADATSSNDRAHTRHLTRAYTGATRARVTQAWTGLI